VIEWNEDMTVPLDSINVMELMKENQSLPPMEKRIKTKEVTDLMREARGGGKEEEPEL
tara:strand:- start:4376 stop:4549 length:174 start_codon:yes stop_codon:yes gene_type:complete